MKIAIYPGSFDPVTNGHIDIINKASNLFDKVYIVVCINKKKKLNRFTLEERLEMLKEATKDIENVEVDIHEGLAVDYAKKRNAVAMIRGVRNQTDFDYEITQYFFNKNLANNLETVVLFPNIENLFVSSSTVNELLSFDSEIDKYVPKSVSDYIKNKAK